jgi:hypothetical protein
MCRYQPRHVDRSFKGRLSGASKEAGENVLWISRCIAPAVFFPRVVAYIFTEIEIEDRQEERFDGYRRSGLLPIFLKERKRKSQGHGHVEKVVMQNSQSRLLMLPREIRDMVFVEAVGGKRIHWQIIDRRLRRTVCRNEKRCLNLGTDIRDLFSKIT